MEARFNPDIKLIENYTCYEEYLSNLIYRVTHASMELEHDLGDPSKPINYVRYIYNQNGKQMERRKVR